MQDPQLSGVFDAAFGLIVFVVSVLAAFALWRSGTRNPRPWKVLLIVVAVVMAVSSAAAGVIAMPRAVEAIDAYLGESRHAASAVSAQPTPSTIEAVTPPPPVTTTTRPHPLFADIPELTDAETVWCKTAEGSAAMWLAGDALEILYVVGGSRHTLTPLQRQALTSVVETGNTGLLGEQHEEFVDQMRHVTMGGRSARACKAAYELARDN